MAIASCREVLAAGFRDRPEAVLVPLTYSHLTQIFAASRAQLEREPESLNFERFAPSTDG